MPDLSQPTLFDDVSEKNVIFLLDTSGSMYCRLPVVKQHLKEYLQKMAFRGGCKFNLIEFSTTVTQWADEMVQCLPETVTVACDWIDKLEAKTGTNTESALLAAYNDEECDAVYLVTDGLPDSKCTEILDRVAYVCNGRACHCIYLTGATVDKEATDFLQDLATDTYGSFTIVTVTNHGSIDRVTPVYKASHAATGVIRTTNKHVYSGTQKQCSVTSTLEDLPVVTPTIRCASVPTAWNPYAVPIVPAGGIVPACPISPIRGPHPSVVYPNGHYVIPGPRVYTEEGGRVLRVPYLNYAFAQWYQPYLWARYRTARSWLKVSNDLDGAISSMSMSPAAGALLIDRPVLARRTEDGLYYRGKVKSQISTDRFLVEFAPCEVGDFKETSYQETFVFDIVQVDDAFRHSVMKGDKVLAPVKDNSDLYAPGTVIDGQEGRENSESVEYKELIVMFATGRSATVEKGKALWIDQLLYDRTAFELKLPKKTRQQIVETVAGYPEDSYPGYPISGSGRDPVEWELPRKFHVTGDDETFQPHNGMTIHRVGYENYRPNLKSFSQTSAVTKAEVERRIPGTNLTEEELQNKVGAQIDANKRILEREYDIAQSQTRLEQRKKLTKQRLEHNAANKEELDRDISILEAELKYKMKLRDHALEQKKKDIDSEIEIKIKERDALMEERRLLMGCPAETRLSRERSRQRSRSPPQYISRSPSIERGRSHSRGDEGYRYRSRSRSLSTERAPSYGHVSPRYSNRSRSLSPNQSRVSFNESLNSHHSYRYHNPDYLRSEDSGFYEGPYTCSREASTNTPVIRNGRELKMKSKRDERPPWRYWKAEPVPDVIDPPFHEPYDQGAVAEPLELRDTNVRTGVLEWGSSHFNKVVPNGRTNYDRFLLSKNPHKSVSFQDNSNVHMASGSNLVTHTSTAEKKLKLRQNESQTRLNNMTASTYYRGGDSVGASMKDFHRERVLAQMEREKSRPSTSYKKQVDAMTSSASTKTSTTNSYQKELNATSYNRELQSKADQMRNMTTEQRRVAAMSARRVDRDLLHAAKLQQEENNRVRSAEMKRERAAVRDAVVTTRIMNDVAKERLTTA